MSDDNSSGFELFSSQPEKQDYDEVPVETLLKFKINDAENGHKISYKLKQGTLLPYSTNIRGDQLLLFDPDLGVNGYYKLVL